MKLTKAIMAAVVLGGFAAQAAHASDLPSRKSPPPVFAPASSVFLDWTGANATLLLGTGWARGDNVAKFGTLGSYNFNDQGSSRLNGGLALGYDYQFARYFVAGVEGDFIYRGGKGNLANVPTGTVVDGHLTQKWASTARVRLGILPIPNVLLYATGGAAYSSFKVDAFSASSYVGESARRLGWTLGGGAEANLTQNVRVRAEYRFTNTNIPGATNGALSVSSGAAKTQEVLVGATYHY